MEKKWGWVICGLVMYKVLIGCGENVGFLPTNYPHILGPAKVKQHRFPKLSAMETDKEYRDFLGKPFPSIVRLMKFQNFIQVLTCLVEHAQSQSLGSGYYAVFLLPQKKSGPQLC